MEKEYLKKLVDGGHSIREISEISGKKYTTVRYWLNKYRFKTFGYKKNSSWDKNELEKVILNSSCKSDVLRGMNISTNSGNFRTLDRYIKKYGIDDSNLKYDHKRGGGFQKKYDDSDVFCVNSPLNNNNIKRRILPNKLLTYECQECGLSDEWNGKIIVLQLDHINGVNDDNRIENLRFLCPNCHSQTETFCSKKIKKPKENRYCMCGNQIKSKRSEHCTQCSSKKRRKIVRPDYDTLKNEIDNLGYVGVGKKYGVSDNAIRKWLKTSIKNL